jgi:hypothetical protein
MITKDKIINLLKAESAKDSLHLVAEERCLSQLCAEYSISDWEGRVEVLNAIFYFVRDLSGSFATELSGEEAYGYNAFCLVMSRAFPCNED